jgi:hypothetical protein
LTHFALDSPLEYSYTLPAPQGVIWKMIFENEQLVVSSQQSAKSMAKRAEKRLLTRQSLPYRNAL